MADRTYRTALSYTDSRGRRFPTVPVTFTYSRSTKPFYGVVDSGAERSTCSASIARAAGIDLALFPVRQIRGVGGLHRARFCPLDLTILGRRISTEILVVDEEVLLFGRHDVFRAFQFAFDERAELLLIEPY